MFLASSCSINKDVFSDCALLGEFFGCWVVQYMCGGLGVLGCGCRLGVGGCSIQGLGVGWSVGQQRWSCVATLTLTLSYSTPPPFTLLHSALVF